MAPHPMSTEDDDYSAADSNTVMTKAIMSSDGTCVKHPHVQLRGVSHDGHVFQRDSCYECDREFESNRMNLLNKQREVDRKLRALESVDPQSMKAKINGPGSGSGPSSGHTRMDGNNNSGGSGSGGGGGSGGGRDSRSGGTDRDDNASNNSGGGGHGGYGSGYPPPHNPYGYPPPPAHHHNPYGYPPPPHHHNHNPYGPPPSGGSNDGRGDKDRSSHHHHQPSPYGAPPGPYGDYYGHRGGGGGGGGGGDSSYLVTLLQQKEEELKAVRNKLEIVQKDNQDQTVQIALLKSKLETNDERLEQDKKLWKLQAEQEANRKLQEQKEKLERDYEIKTANMQKSFDASRKQWEQQERMLQSANQSAGQKQPPMAPASPPSSTPKLDKPRSLMSPIDLDAETVASSDIYHDGTDTSTMGNSSKIDDRKPPPNSGSSSNNNNHNSSNGSTKGSKPWNDDKKYNDQKGGQEPTNQESDSMWGSSVLGGASTSNGSTDRELEDTDKGEGDDQFESTPKWKEPKINVQKQQPSNITGDDDEYVGTSNRFDPKYVTDDDYPSDDDDDPVDEKSLGQTVASSTYGEDRQKVVNQSLLDPYGDKGVYTGVVLRTTGMPHGLGRMIYEEDGRIYEGDWRHGRWHGFGRASFSNGDSYEGEYKFDQRHGRGVYRWHDGRVYDGQFSEDKRHGKGMFTWPDGAIYDGEFVNGQREGHGKYTFADGGQYDGAWKDGRYDGFGSCTWEDGRQYRGEWRNGMAHGRGTETYPNGTIRHEGQWIDDEPVR